MNEACSCPSLIPQRWPDSELKRQHSLRRPTFMKDVQQTTLKSLYVELFAGPVTGCMDLHILLRLRDGCTGGKNGAPSPSPERIKQW